MKLLSLDAVSSEGGLLPIDLLARVKNRDSNLPGLEPGDFYLQKHERLNEAAERAWTRVLSLWRGFQHQLQGLPSGHHATGSTHTGLLLPLFEELGYGRLDPAPAFSYEGKTLQVSHLRKHSPIHLVGWAVDLDRKSDAPGASQAPPHGLLQELLNREQRFTWGFVCNGRELRVLRDHHSLTRQAYVAFDLEKILGEERFDEFFLLWLVCHQSRVDAPPPEPCFLERWFESAREQGINALGALRDGVGAAIELLGQGFLAHPANAALHGALQTGQLDRQDYYRHLLRLIYRLIFLFVAEERELLLDPGASELARQRYRDHYSLRRLRAIARRHKGSDHGDLWQALRLVMGFLAEGQPLLGLPALGSRLWASDFCGLLPQLECSNRHLLGAIRELAFTREQGQTYPVNWQNIGSLELGGIYESLLERHPVLERDKALFRLETTAGNDRKTSGSYYTPPALVDQLLDTALEPVLRRACASAKPEAAVLALTICDPSCGSGHFLVAAAHRTAKRLAALRTGDAEPAPLALRAALRDVIGHCIHGVDLNPMTVELCKLSLWLEALEPGKPLSFLDHHIQVGNSLLGTTPALMARGIPAEAFEAIGDDDKKTANRFAKRHRTEKLGQASLFATFGGDAGTDTKPILAAAYSLEAVDDQTLGGVRQKERAYRQLQDSPAYQRALFKANLWCAALVWPKPAPGPELDEDFVYAVPTEDTWKRILLDPDGASPLTRRITAESARLYQFFHWHLAFPHVFGATLPNLSEDTVTGWSGGFDVVLGNPPWERIKLQEVEFFAQRSPAIAAANNAAARKRAIAALAQSPEGQALFAEWRDASRAAEGQSFILRTSGRYPLCARGDINTYSVFTELDRSSLAAHGRMGIVVPGGIAMDDTTKFFFQDIVERGSIHSLYHFENEEFVFKGVDHRVRFCLLTLAGEGEKLPPAEFVCYARQVAHLKEEARKYVLSPADFQAMNPNTRTLPAFRSARDAQINRAIYQRVPVLWDEQKPDGNPWGISFMSMLHMANDSGLFRSAEELAGQGWQPQGNRFVREGEEMLPLYEAKMIHHFTHRFGTYEAQTEAQARQSKLPECTPEMQDDPNFEVKPRYWVEKGEVDSRLKDRWDRGWFLCYRNVCKSSDARSVINGVIPRYAANDKTPIILCQEGLALGANLSSFVLDYSARQNIGGSALSFFIVKQIPVLHPKVLGMECIWDHKVKFDYWLNERAIELTYTSYELAAFASDFGFYHPPFRFNESRRILLRAELDAAFFHLYGIARDDVDHIMESFWGARQKDEKQYGDYRTKHLILQCYDAMAQAIASGVPYQTLLDPPPADPSLCHPPREER